MGKPDVILERCLTLDTGQAVHAVTVRITRPEPDPLPGGAWRCGFSVEGIPNSEAIVKASYGADPMQAAIMTLQHVRLELRLLQADGLHLKWLGDVDLGFPNLAEDEPSIDEWRRMRSNV